MTSPAWRFKQRCERTAEAERLRTRTAAAEQAALEQLTENKEAFDLLLTSLQNDLARISALPQGSARLPLKTECVKVYAPYVETYLTGEEIYHNPVLVQSMIWKFDLGDIAGAMRLAAVAIEQKQPMPDRFKSSVPIFVADAVLDWATRQIKAGGAVAPYFDTVFDSLDTWPLHDKQRAKYCKFAAEQAVDAHDFARAVELCDRAVGYDSGAQVKTMRANAEKEVLKAAEAAKPTTHPAGGGDVCPTGQTCPTCSDKNVPPPASLEKGGKK